MVLLPYYRKIEFLDILGLSGFEICEVWNIRSFAHQQPFRCIVHWGQKAFVTKENDLVIYQSPNVYTSESTSLLAPYYLQLPD